MAQKIPEGTVVYLKLPDGSYDIGIVRRFNVRKRKYYVTAGARAHCGYFPEDKLAFRIPRSKLLRLIFDHLKEKLPKK